MLNKSVHWMSFFALVFVFQFFELFLTSLLQLLFNMFFMPENHFFPLFISLAFLSFSCPFFLVGSCHGGLMAKDKTRHQEKWVKPVVGMVTKVWKVFSSRVFWAWPKVWIVMDLNQPKRMPWLIIEAKVWQQQCVSCDWLTCVWHRQPAGHQAVKTCHNLLMFSLTLLFSFCLLKTGNLRRRSWTWRIKWSVSKIKKKIVLENHKFVERQLDDLEEETKKLADGVTAALVIYEEHMSDCRTRPKLISHMAWAKNQSNDTKRKNLLFTEAKWMHPYNVLEWKQIHC